MKYSKLLHVLAVNILTAATLWRPIPAVSAHDPLTQVSPTTVTGTLFASDGRNLGKTPELTDGNSGSRWIFRTTDTPANYLPVRLVFDMGVTRAVGKVRIANYFTGSNFERGFKVVDIFVGDAMPPRDERNACGGRCPGSNE
ncbi:MAG TPA: hypothetical protein VHV83_08615 [Armatimonadota bacterium]|nr:hypothetical protein [Armatimonadota bacterium]